MNHKRNRTRQYRINRTNWASRISRTGRTSRSGRWRILLGLILVGCLFLGYSGEVHAEENLEDELLRQQAETSDVQKLGDQMKKYSTRDVEEILGEFNPESIIQSASKGDFSMNAGGILENAVRYLLKEIYLNLHILLKILVLIVLCAVLKNLQTSFLSESVGEAAFYVCYIIIVSVLMVSFGTAMQLGIGIIDSMVGFMMASLPVMITLLVAGGNITSGGIFQPIMLMIVQVAATLIRNFFIPMIFLSTVLSVINNISDKIQLSRLAALIKQITGWALGIILTVFIGVVSIQGSLGAVIDGVTSKTAKFAIGAFIPVVGKYLADAADTVIGCTLLIKNAAGVAAMIAIIAICIVPLLKILALVGLYKAICALAEPISDKRITGCINDISGSMVSIFGVSSAVAFMFLITITAIVSAGNLSAMIR